MQIAEKKARAISLVEFMTCKTFPKQSLSALESLEIEISGAGVQWGKTLEYGGKHFF